METIQVHNRPAVLKQQFTEKSLVRWQDNGTLGVVYNDALPGNVRG
jgi:hypothetical protein